MARAALRLLGFLLCGCAAAHAAEVRRPVPALKINGREYVRILDVAARLKLSLRWVEAGRKVELAGAGHTLELGGRFGGQQITVDGLNVFLGDPVVSRAGDVFVSRIDLEHRLVPLLHPTWNGPIPRHPLVVAIDPGHGGFDPGFQNVALHLQEKTLALDTALRLKRLLEKAGYQVVMTRTKDQAVAATKELDLPRRPEIANLAHADLFISIHFNSASPDPRPHGTEIYTFPPLHQSSTEAALARQDDSDPSKRFPGPSVANQFDPWNAIFAHAVHRQLLARIHTDDRGEKLKHLAVLRGLDCPGILVESGFLSNDAEARRDATPAFREEIAEGMLAGIAAYTAEIDALRPPIPALASPAAAPVPRPAAAPAKTLAPPQRPS